MAISTISDRTAITYSGAVLQVVNATYNTQVSTSSTSYIDTGLSASITPTSSTSKILILVSQNLNVQSDNTIYLTINRESTAVYTTFWPIASQTAGNLMINTFEQVLDSPATTGLVTYKTQFRSRDLGETVVAQRESNAPSSITLMEIAA